MTSISYTRNKEYIACFPTICVETPPLIKAACNIELVLVSSIITSGGETSKSSSFWLHLSRWGRGVDCLKSRRICNAGIICKILIPKLVTMGITPVPVLHIINRKWSLYSNVCSLISTNSLPCSLVIIIGLIFSYPIPPTFNTLKM